MPRARRVYEPGFSHHVFQRGHNLCAIFDEDDDREHFLYLVAEAARCHEVEVHAYTLMTTHYHLIVTPGSASALPNAMKDIDGEYVRYYNRKNDRLGTLWCGRYKAKLIADREYWLTCLRYVEWNPVEAGIVDDAAAYRWSSYRVHAFGAAAGWLTTHPLYEELGSTPAERQLAYRTFCECQTP